MFKVRPSHVHFVALFALVTLLAGALLVGAGLTGDAIAGISTSPGYGADSGEVSRRQGSIYDGNGGAGVAGLDIGGST
ncbi:MAG: hypothetical protein R3272_10230, partial [Candidatus Promineifilaceae bacterium]|nr:hypothetical protein [Candidatus Promineifilaceae bacterium]